MVSPTTRRLSADHIGLVEEQLAPRAGIQPPPSTKTVPPATTGTGPRFVAMPRCHKVAPSDARSAQSSCHVSTVKKTRPPETTVPLMDGGWKGSVPNDRLHTTCWPAVATEIELGPATTLWCSGPPPGLGTPAAQIDAGAVRRLVRTDPLADLLERTTDPR